MVRRPVHDQGTWGCAGSGPPPKPCELAFATLGDEDPARLPTADELQQVIYRSCARTGMSYSLIRHPGRAQTSSDHRGRRRAPCQYACRPADSIENAVWLSAVKAVGAATQLREIRQQAASALVRSGRAWSAGRTGRAPAAAAGVASEYDQRA